MYTPEAMLKSIPLSTQDPKFPQALYKQLITRPRTQAGTLREQVIQAIDEEYALLSEQMDATGLQDSCSARILLRARALAALFINEKGEWELEAVQIAEEHLKAHLYSLAPHRRHDALRNEHLLRVCQQLLQNKPLRQQIRAMHRPTAHRIAEQLLRDSLQVPPEVALTDTHARRAGLSAWMCYLRQNVGSCFATAPAILIQREQPGLLLRDLHELLTTGRLKRVYGGVEYAVPLAPSWGSGDLRRSVTVYKEHAIKQLMEIARSPAMERACATASIPQDKEELKVALKKIGTALFKGKVECTLSPEDLLKALLLDAYDLSAAELTAYLERPTPMMLQSLVAFAPKVPKGKNSRLEQFPIAFERACSAYKSLTEHALLRAWEFTIASFSETKAQFSTWNLYSSLGMQSNEPGGIGEKLFAIVHQRWEESKLKIQSYQDEYEMLYGQLMYCEGRLKSASSEEEVRFLRAEYESKRNEFHLFEQMRDRAVRLTNHYANFFSQLIDAYMELFTEFFQEVYDPDLREVAVGPYDDSPAGFRLLCKHGRSNTALWTLIQNRTQFVEALAAFFIFAESSLSTREEWELFSQDLSTITTTIVGHVRSEEFLLSALKRMAQSHGMRLPDDPLNHLDKIEKKPWAYTSGGTMDTLVSCYYCREDKPTEKGRWVENEAELATFFIDCIKQIPEPQAKILLKSPGKSLLTHSPTHAFLFQPSFTRFMQGVQDNSYTYIWLRDQVIEQQKRFLYGITLDREEVQHFLNRLSQQLPKGWQEEFTSLFTFIPSTLRPHEMRHYIAQELSQLKGWRWQQGGVPQEKIDSLLYSMLPMASGSHIPEKLHQLFMTLPGFSTPRAKCLVELYMKGLEGERETLILGADELQALALSLLSLEKGELRTPYDAPLALARAAQELGSALPTPLLFADSNWVTDFFGFAVNPGDGEFSLWRFDYTGSTGSPMASWKHWLNGSDQQRTWGLYVRPSEYEATHIF